MLCNLTDSYRAGIQVQGKSEDSLELSGGVCSVPMTLRDSDTPRLSDSDQDLV